MTLTWERAFCLTKEKIRPRSFPSLISHEIMEVVVVQWRPKKKLAKSVVRCRLVVVVFVCLLFFIFLEPIELIFDVTLPPSSIWLSELPNIT